MHEPANIYTNTTLIINFLFSFLITLYPSFSIFNTSRCQVCKCNSTQLQFCSFFVLYFVKLQFFFLCGLLLLKGVEEGGGVEAENWEEERRRSRIGSLKKKAINASSRFTHSLKKRGKRKIDFRVPIEDVRDAKEESAVQELRQRLLQKGFMPPTHDDYHALLRSFSFLFFSF